MEEETICKQGVFKWRHLAGSCSKLRPLTLFYYSSFSLWWTNLTGIDWKPGSDGPFYNCMCQMAGWRAAWWIEPADRSLSRSGAFQRPDGRGGELIFFCVKMWTWCCSLGEWLCFSLSFVPPLNLLIAPMMAAASVGFCSLSGKNKYRSQK